MCYHAEFGRSALKGVGINTGEPPKIGSHETLFSGWEAWLIPRYTLIPTCYHVKFGSSAIIKDVRINRKEHQYWEHWDPAPPPRVIMPNLVDLGKTARALLRRSA